MADLDSKNIEQLSREELQGLVRQLRADRAGGDGGESAGQPSLAAVGASVYRGPALASTDEALVAYRAVMIWRCGRFSFVGMESSDAADDTAPRLENVFINPDTPTRVAAQTLQDALYAEHPPPLATLAETAGTDDARPLSALEAAALQRRLVLLGAAGSGKTTLLRRLCLALASQRWEGLEPWPPSERDRLPIWVSLRDFARWLNAQPRLPDAGAPLLWTYLRHDLGERNLALAEDALATAVARGRAQICLDGLDEVPADVRPSVIGTLVDFAKSHHRAALLVTCQSDAYASAPLPEKRFPVVTLAPFDRDKSQRFIDRWCREWAAREPATEEPPTVPAARLKETLERPDLSPLSGSPLWLALIAWVDNRDQGVPAHRVGLYDRAVHHLLLGWRGEDACGETALPIWLEAGGCDRPGLLRALAGLAFAGAASDDPAAALMNENALLQTLATLHAKQSEAWARVLLGQLNRGLLVERAPGVFTLLNPQLHDYLAAVHVAHADDFANQCARLAEQPARWREILRLAVAHKALVQGDAPAALNLVDALCERGGGAEGLDGLRLAGVLLLDLGVDWVVAREGGERVLDGARERLTSLVERGRLEPLERAWVGDLLGRLGDPRFAARHAHLPCRYRGRTESGLGLVRIAAGSFWMGGERSDPEAAANEVGNPDPLTIPYAYWVARYPVTVAQYQAFVLAGGYAEASWWRTEAARSWLYGEPNHAPLAWSNQLPYLNRPVTGVTWYEAMAYCAWLDAQLRAPANSPLPPSYLIRLPTEAEWERAARGHAQVRYPWGNADWHRQRANTKASDIGHPTPVGLYPAGVTPTGLHDLAGNVWEWTLSKNRDYPYDPRNDPHETTSRIVRGGSWNDPPQVARCAARASFYADHGNGFLGFRVVVSVAGDETCPSF